MNVEYVRDSEEYWTLIQRTYYMAAKAVEEAGKPPAPKAWAVVRDVDDPLLDNSAYQSNREGYALP